MHHYHIGNTGLQSQVLQSFKALFSICIIFVRTGPLAEGILEGDVSLAGALHAFLITGEEAKPSKRKKSERERERVCDKTCELFCFELAETENGTVSSKLTGT